MRGMELKVWVDGVQRIVCGVTEVTTCQEVVIALAQAIGRTGRYTLIEKWRETERHLAPHENPVVSLNKWVTNDSTEREQELEQLTKELRQVNLQQFIQQTGTKVTVLPADPGEEEANTESENQSGSLKRLGSARQLPADLRALQSPLNTTFNPEGIYV
ncbi:ras association domain-containing protein 8-like [Sinocyclocheilus anshuiensis]|uniref:ras association domain-containing protein 8-like n=1 Tax=Sinocyclocheilus anshuiensis TaxID=1608454 RepID=UPI0007B7B775|nr:PREDICTED: ras association domain-containing protein 8-like [Sinocyclocheilus anshuiensis]